MKRWKLLSVMVAVSCVAMGVRAEDKKITFFGQVEYLTYSGAFDKQQDKFNEVIADDSVGLDETTEKLSSNSDTAGGAGFRIGALAVTPVKGLKVGGSVGYILGPSFKANENYSFDDGFVAWTEDMKWKDESHLWRFLAESKYSVPMGEKFQARLGVGLGFAILNVKDKYSSVSSGFFTDSYSTEDSLTTTKFTWEIGPAIAYVTNNIGVELALTYSQMPSAENTQTFQKFDWNPFGVRLGVEF